MTDAVRGLTGRAFEAQPGQQADLAAVGAKPISGQEAASSHQAWQQMKDVDANWSTPEKALGGVFSGLTLGLGPAGLAAAGLADRNDVEGLKGSGAYQAGDIAGMIAPSLLTGGEGAAARGALEAEGGLLGRALGWTPAGLMSRAGAGAEALAGRLIPEVGVLGQVGKSTLQMAARGSTEGAIVNLAHTVSDSYIQDKPLTAQSLAASGVNGALLGGLAGGILGGVSGAAGAGVDAVGSSAVRAGAGKGEEAAATALKRLGATESELGRMSLEEGGLVGAVRKYHDVLENGGESFASKTSDIGRSLKATGKGYEDAINEVITTLDKEAPNALPDIERMAGRIQGDLSTKYTGTFLQDDALRLASDLVDSLQPLAAGGSWKRWVASRDQLADLVAKGRGGLQEDIYRTAMNSMNDEIGDAMKEAGKQIGKESIGEQFRAAVMGQKLSEEMGGMVQSKLGKELTAGNGGLRPADMGTMAWGTLMGHPAGAAGIVAAKGIYRTLERKIEPAMAEAAYRAAVGAQAAKATVQVGQHVTSTFRKFMGLGGKVAALESADSGRPKYTLNGFKETMDLSDKLLDHKHQAKVQDLTSAMNQMGHGDLGNEMAAQYMRATEYLNHNKPKSEKLKEAGSLTKLPGRMGLDTKEMRYMRIFSAISNPMSVVDGIMDGTASREAVNAVAYVMPEWHQDIVSRAAQVILEAKGSGKYLPADKEALLGLVLNSPVSSKLEKPFIDEVQKGLAANAQPQPEANKPPPPGQMQLAQTADYQTPMQTSMS